MGTAVDFCKEEGLAQVGEKGWKRGGWIGIEGVGGNILLIKVDGGVVQGSSENEGRRRWALNPTV